MEQKIKNILVTGANGQLGNELRELSGRYPAYRFLFTDVADLDITDAQAVRGYVEAERPAWIINAAAYTAVDKAESDPEKAALLNATAVENLAAAASAVGAGLVQVSTDYVFPGDSPEPLTEEDAVGPRSVYGRTKRDGELAALTCPRSFVVRTAWLYSTFGNNFVKTMMRLGSERDQLNVVADQWGTPTYAADLAEALVTMIVKADSAPNEPLYGVYHYTNGGVTCWADFAAEIMRMSGRSCAVNPITTAEYPVAAPRPAFSILSKRKICDTFEIRLPEWESSLELCIEKLMQAEAAPAAEK